MRTSQTDPLRVDFVTAFSVPGQLGMTFAPGKKAAGIAGLWHRDLAADLRRLRDHYGTGTLVTLVEHHEFGELAIPDLLDQVQQAGIDPIWFPIRDQSVPPAIPPFQTLITSMVQRLQQGETVVAHCKGGLGRTGLVAAACLVMLGRAPDEAIAQVRRARAGTVETREQADYVRRFADVLQL